MFLPLSLIFKVQKSNVYSIGVKILWFMIITLSMQIKSKFVERARCKRLFNNEMLFY